MHGAPVIVRDEVGLSGEEHLLKLFDISAYAKQYLPPSVEQFQATFQRRSNYRRRPFTFKMSGPGLSRFDRIFH